MDSSSPPEPNRKGLGFFFLVLAVLAALRLLTTLVGVPVAVVQPASIALTAVFVIAPVLALFRAADYPWSPRLALAFVGGGVAAWLGGWLLGREVLSGLPAAVSVEISQAGLMVWAIGLGALLGTWLKDKNLLIPVSLFLIAFDAFLILTPTPIQQLSQAPMVQSLMLSSPKVHEVPTMAPAQPYAVIGPADLVFMGMFFIALFRFHMRTRETLIALVPTLVLYLALASQIGSLPALVPIGICVLLVNWSEFKLNKEEWASTALVAALGFGLVIWGMSRPRSQAEPSPMAPVREGPRPADSPVQAS